MKLSPPMTNNQVLLLTLVLFSLINRSQIQAQETYSRYQDEIDSLSEKVKGVESDETLQPKINKMTSLLTRLLLVPWPEGAAPLLYIENPNGDEDYSKHNEFDDGKMYDLADEETMRPVSPKRSKYYRKYPWKREQTFRYDPTYICTPDKSDIFRLLVAVHGEKDGPRGQSVDFCNRRRPALFVITNIRFTG